ncbi:hypothetical protein NQ314_006800 [Rhamnusium bicolor]|uniref:Uncharacterized protein n=1 Tax=Rhamnusium bicolor TaxID=1586634 RepID=A0AAV8YWI7_9CUCU|nr:hypothetical protein NQ314_006800 [Rhamnusium bicolor]
MSQVQELIRTLINFIISREELIKDKNINLNVAQTLNTCFYYSVDIENQNLDSRKLLEIDSVLDFLQDELNTGHWSNVPVHVRRCFSSASLIKCLLLLKCSETYSVELLQKCLKCLDMGLLLGAPLEENHELLTNSARHLSEEIKKLLGKCNFETIPRTTSVKRKIDSNNQSQFAKLTGKEIDVVDCPSVEYFNKKYFMEQLPAKLKGCIDHWPATKKWLDLNYLLDIAGDRTIPVEIGSHYADVNWSQKLMTLKEFITKHYLGTNVDIGYLAQHNLFEQGDYNLPKLKWTNDEFGVCVPDSAGLAAKAICDSFVFHNLFQLNHVNNCYNVILDLFFTHNVEAPVNIVDDYLINGDSHHPALYVSIPIATGTEILTYAIYYYNFKKDNYIDLNNYLTSVDWDGLLGPVIQDIDAAVDIFYKVLAVGILLFH